MTEVRTRDEAIALVDQALNTWSANLAGVLTQARSTARAASSQADWVVRQRDNEVAATEAMLRSAEPAKRGELEVKLVRAKEAHERARRAQVQINDVADEVAQLGRSHTTATSIQVAGARAQLSAMSRALEGYRCGSLALGGGGAGGSASAKGGGRAAAFGGLSAVDVGAVDLDDNPILDDGGSQGTFGKGGLSRADYRWAVQTWNDTVGPGVAGGRTRDDFAARDAHPACQGELSPVVHCKSA